MTASWDGTIRGWEPPLRDHREPLTLDTVEEWADEYRRGADCLVERFRRAPSPDEMIADLISRAAIPGWEAKVSDQ